MTRSDLAALVVSAIATSRLPAGRLEVHVSPRLAAEAGWPVVVAGVPVRVESRLSGGWLLVEAPAVAVAADGAS